MHIVQLADYGGPYAGSFIPLLRAIGAEADRRGHTFEVVFTPVAQGRAWLSELAAAEIPASFAASRSQRDLRDAVLAAAPDAGTPLLLHSHFTAFDRAALRAASRRRRTATLWHVHTRLESGARAVTANAIKFGLLGRRVDRIVCVAPHIASAVRRRLGPARRIVTMPNAVDVVRFPLRTGERVAAARERLGLADSAAVLAHMGRLWELKGGDLLLEAARLLHDEGTDVLVLTVAGGEQARRAAARLSLEDSVRVIEPSDDVATLYTAADVFVACSRAEGMPYSLLEAAATGTGILASDIPGQGTLARRLPGAQVSALEPRAMADALARLLARDAATVAAEAAAAHDWVLGHADVSASARALVDLYEQLL